MKLSLVILFALLVSGCNSIAIDKTELDNLRDCAVSLSNDRKTAYQALNEAESSETWEDLRHNILKAQEYVNPNIIALSCENVNW